MRPPLSRSYALRYPLKGPLADVTGVTSARMRFNFKTLQVTHKIDQSDGHYNSSAVAACQLKQITHESSVSPGHVGFAVGKIKDGEKCWRFVCDGIRFVGLPLSPVMTAGSC